MSQDIIADALNEIMNAKRAGKKTAEIKNRTSRLLMNIFEIMKDAGYIDYKSEDGGVVITIKKLNECCAIKPRYNVRVKSIDRYIKRFLPARDFGLIIISTSDGLITHYETKEKNIGGCLIAYCF